MFSSFELSLQAIPNSHQLRDYGATVLPNGITCVVISDPSSHLVTGALAAAAGSLNDPEDIPGLAHLCEHLILYGTKKGRNFASMLARSGAVLNAYTKPEVTCFNFEVLEYGHVAPGTDNWAECATDTVLHGFSSLFNVSPFKKEFVRAEIAAVHDEHTANKASLDRIAFHAIRLIARKSHPFSRFATGSKTTFDGVAISHVTERVEQHRMRFFAPSRKAVVLKGPQSVTRLLKAVTAYFGPVIGSSNIGYCDVPKGQLFSATSLRIFIRLAAFARLRMVYPLSGTSHIPHLALLIQIACQIIGNECRDSLCEFLKRKMLYATSVMVSSQLLFADEYVLIIDIDLSATGLKHVPDIVSAVLYYIHNVLYFMPHDDLKSLLQDYDTVEHLAFLNRKESGDSNEVCTYAERILLGQINSFLSDYSGVLPTVYDDFRHLLSLLCQQNANLILLGPDSRVVGKTSDCFSIDTHYEFEYCSFNLEIPDAPLAKYFAPPPRLDCLTFDVRHQPIFPAVKGIEIKYVEPTLVQSSCGYEVWAKQENDGLGIYSLCASFPVLNTDSRNLVFFELLAELIGESLLYSVYQFTLVGCNWGIYANCNGTPGLLINVHAPLQYATSLMQKLVLSLVDEIQNIENVRYSRWKRARAALRRRYIEQDAAKGVTRAFSALTLALEKDLVVPDLKIACLEAFGPEDVVAFSQALAATPMRCVVLSAGKLDLLVLEPALTLGSVSNTYSSAISESYYIPRGVRCLLYSTDDDFSTVVFYLQLGQRNDLVAVALGKLLHYAISLRALDELRQRKNLAYAVHDGLRFFRATFGVHITLVTGLGECTHVTAEIEAFLRSLISQFEKISDESFSTDFVIPFLERDDPEPAPTSLFAGAQPVHGSGEKPTSKEFRLHWSELDQIMRCSYKFGDHQCEDPTRPHIVRQTTRRDFVNYLRLVIGEMHAFVVISKMGPRKRLSVLGKVILQRMQASGCKISELEMEELVNDCVSGHPSELLDLIKSRLIKNGNFILYLKLASTSSLFLASATPTKKTWISLSSYCDLQRALHAVH